jgi:patatin-like phospholipase/acyl hydrolase
MGEERPLRVLTLDGGGVRGLAEVLMLKNLFERVGFEVNAGRRSARLPEPQKFLDLICGTSTGGWLSRLAV